MYNYYKLNYWFNLRPEPLPNLILLFLVLLGVLMLVFNYVYLPKILKRKNGGYKKMAGKLEVFCVFNAVVAFTLAFSSYELVPLFAARFLLVLWVIGLAVWCFLLKKTFDNTRDYLNSVDKSNQTKSKYLPKKK